MKFEEVFNNITVHELELTSEALMEVVGSIETVLELKAKVDMGVKVDDVVLDNAIKTMKENILEIGEAFC